ncbi:MAG: hypothetical protein J5517_00100 [Eubacterium sp.]|nr:hypothetical protein [Eubacterium sp.]
MKRSSVLKRIVALILAVMIAAVMVPGEAQAAKKKTGWVTKKGYKYYYDEEGKLQTGFVEIKGNTYYFAPKKITTKITGSSETIVPKGAMLKGWYKIKKKYYYFDRSTGKMAKNKKVDAIKLTKTGAAKTSSYNKKKMNLMILARERMMVLTNASDKKEAKLKKCFDWCKKTPYIGYHFLKNERSKKGWDILFASDILDPSAHTTAAGECTAMAASFAYLAHECGYKTVYIVDDDRSLKGDNHSWAEINGKIYDPLFARTSGKGGDEANFGGTYKSSDYGHVKINTLEISSGKIVHGK